VSVIKTMATALYPSVASTVAVKETPLVSNLHNLGLGYGFLIVIYLSVLIFAIFAMEKKL